MKKTQIWAISLTVLFIIASLWSLYPTFRLWSMSSEERQKKKQTEGTFVDFEKRAMKLGLDLQGGMHIVMEVDKSKLNEAEKKDAVERALEIIRNRIDKFGVTEPQIQKSGEDRIVVELPGVQETERAKNLLGQTAQLEFKLLETPENTKTLLNRIDEIVAATGSTDTKKIDTASIDQTVSIFGQTTPLKGDTAKAISDTEPESRPFSGLMEPVQYGWFTVAKDDMPRLKRILASSEVQGVIPPDVEFLWSARSSFSGAQEISELYLTKKQVELSGKYLTDAREGYGSQGLVRTPVVNFSLTREGGAKFARLTGANIDKPLAIILDDKVISAPTIRDRIRDRGEITLGGNSTLDDAHDLAIILKAGALPAPVRIIESNVIGPSLGADSISKGKFSFLVGMVAVLLFMGIYYKLSGVIADFALILNFLFLVGAMAGLHATLTMPGIAGIILTMGMSVDSNVLIFERIREELRAGKTVRAGIDAGYKRAIWTVIDSHVTTLIAAAVLFKFGTGPVKGFAVSLSLGVLISLYTAVIVTRAVFDMRKRYQVLSI